MTNRDQQEQFEAISKAEAKRIMAEAEKESSLRTFSGVPREIMRWLCVAFTLVVLALNTFWLQPTQIHRASFVGLLLFYSFILYPAGKRAKEKVNYIPWYDVVLAFAGAGAFFYYVVNFRAIAGQMATYTQMDFIVAVIGIVILFIACYRVMGLPIMIVVGAFLAYAYFGYWIPGIFGHAGFRVERIFTYLFYTTEGVIGIPTGVASTFIFLFILFGAFLEKTKIGNFFIDIANSIAGRAVGGPAKVVVIASALQGTVTGSSVANTVATGSFTIPLMKRIGYDKNFAGAVEAASSTGGQIMPPVMGAAAFLMVEITGIPYGQILLAAMIPAALYFAGIMTAVHFEAKKTGLSGMSADEIPKFLPLILKKGYLLLPLASIVFFIFQGYSISRAALYAIGVAIVVSMFSKDTRLTPKAFVSALENGARNVIGVGVACAMAGMIVGVVTMTGLGLTFANSLLSMADGIQNEGIRLFIVLLFTMIASILLGLGVPTTAKYVIMAVVTGPILVQLGLPLLAAHMFVFYFGILADITPPVALTAYAASAISGGDPLKTSVIASRLAIAAFIVPFIFAFNPEMLWIGDPHPLEMLKIALTAFLGIVGLASGLAGYLLCPMRWYERLLAIGAGLFLIYPELISDIVGLIVIGGIFFAQRIRNKNDGGFSAA
ncbi:MAG: TRAP transporter permease [Oscillospiraceae bacterium]|nr:TRAP transporter permease [Oscillospiraceae bacterium]